MSENTARASGVFASSDTRQPGDDGESSTDDGDVTPTPDSDGESTGFSDQLFLVNRTSSGTETDASQRASLPASSVFRFKRQEPDSSSSSSGENCRERGARGQRFIAYQLTESQDKILRLEKVQKKVMEDLRSSSTCFKFDKTDNTTFLVKPAIKARLDKILKQNIRTEQFDVREGDDVDYESLNTEELQHEMVSDLDDETLTLVYHVTTESKILEILNKLQTPQREIQLSFAVSRLLEVQQNLQRVIKAFHCNLGFQVHMEFCKDDKNGPVLRVKCNRTDRHAAFPKAEQYIAAIERSALKISLPKGLYLQGLHGQRVLQAIARRHHCVLTVETPAQRVLLRASHRDDVLLVCEGNLACCCPQVFILPLCEGQTEWPPLYKHIMERALLSSDAGKYTGLFAPPSTPWIHPITYSSGSNKRTIIIMYVPKLTGEDDFQRQLQESCKAAMRSAIGVFPEAEIVLPITLGDTVPLKCCALPLMMAVKETIRNVRSSLYVKLFFEKSHQNVPDIVADMKKRLIGWSLDQYLENTALEKVASASSKDGGDVDGATVRLVGLKQDVAKATDEMSTIDNPPEYEVRAEEFKKTYSKTVADSSLKVIQRRTIPKSETSTSASRDQQGLQEAVVSADTCAGSNRQLVENRGSMRTSVLPSAANDTPRPQPQAREDTEEETDLCHFTLPQRLFTMKHLSVLMENLELATLIQNLETVDEPGPSKRFTLPASCLLPVVTEVMKLINLPPEQQRSSQGTKRQGEQQKTINMPRHNYLALISLMRKEFESMFTVLNEDVDQVTIACKEPSPPQQVIDRMQSLRREEVQIPKEETMKLGQPFNTVSEGVDAFILPLPDEEKVIIFSFEYNNFSKAKHLVNVRIGKVKVRTRNRRRLDGTWPDSGGSITDQSPPGSLRPTSSFSVPGAVTSEFTTKSGIKVSIYKTDITKLPVDAIVNAANEHLDHGRGVAHAIARAAGFELEEEGDEYIKTWGPQRVTEIAVTKAGMLPCINMLHAVEPRWTDYEDKALCQKDLTKTLFNCLKTTGELGLSTLAVSSITSATFGVPPEIRAESYVSAVQSFDDQYGGNTSIKHVHFVDVNENRVKIIGTTFSKMWDKPISIAALQVPVNAYNREEAKTRQWNTERSAGTQTHRDMISTKGNAHTEQINQTASGASSDYSRPPTRVNSDFNLSDPGSKSTHKCGAGSSHLGGTTANRAESQLRETKELQKGARGLEPRGSEQRPQSQGITPQIETIAPGGVEAQYQVHFGGLDLILQRQSITHLVTDFIVLWQSYGSVLQDVHSQNVIKREGNRFQKEDVPLLKDKLQNGEMVVHSCGPRRHLLLQIIGAAAAMNREKLGQIIQNMLEKVQSMGRRTVVMPTFKINKVSSYTTAQFAAGVYLAIRKHMERSPRPITEVHIVDSDGDYLKDLAEAFKVELFLDMSSRQPEQGRNGEHLKRSMGPKCPVCLDTLKQPTSLDKCGHTFCTDCIAACFRRKPVCPECQTIYGIVYGDQPKDGKMKMKKKSFSLPAYKESDTFFIEYDFPNGIRDGSRYRGTSRTAFLPNTVEGRKVLMLLKTAFDRGLVFTVGQSATISSEELRVTWNGIHHKTEKNGGANNGYPDPTYLIRVQEELAASGVTLQDLTIAQTQFIHTPERFYPFLTPHGDFGDWFDQRQKNPPWK